MRGGWERGRVREEERIGVPKSRENLLQLKTMGGEDVSLRYRQPRQAVCTVRQPLFTSWLCTEAKNVRQKQCSLTRKVLQYLILHRWRYKDVNSSSVLMGILGEDLFVHQQELLKNMFPYIMWYQQQ